jgi:hypothetical protein
MLANSNVFFAPVHSYLKPWYCFYIQLQYQRLRGKKWRQSQKPICELNQSKHEAVASMHTECEAISSVPLITDEKYKKLLFHLVKMKNQLDTFQIIQHLENPSTTPTKEKSCVYQDKCIDFCKRKFALKDHQITIDQYLIKMIAYSGLLIHDILRVKHIKNLVDHQNVFAHVLSYCLEGTYDTSGSYKEQNQNVWKNFFSNYYHEVLFPWTKLSVQHARLGHFSGSA